MANTLGTLAGDLIAQKALDYLTETYPLLSLIANDVSEGQALYNQTVVTRINSVPAAKAFDPTVGYAADPAVSTDVSVTLDKHIYSSVEFSEQELSSTNINLIDDFAMSLSYSIGDSVMGDIGTLLGTAATYTNESVAPIASFTRVTGVLDPRGALAARKVNNGLVEVLTPQAETALWSDDSIVSLNYNRTGGISAQVLPEIHGVKISRMDSLPSGLNAVVLSKDAVIFCSRTPQIETSNPAGEIRNVSNEQGLSIQYRRWHDMKRGVVQLAFTVMYGVAAGNPTCAQRVVETATP